ncbi:MAG: hypothetical protein HOP07_11805 [Bacteriovoracaceae bacterium]|nr:hypothetical protein [Bacteriovoracaceae bacterium]
MNKNNFLFLILTSLIVFDAHAFQCDAGNDCDVKKDSLGKKNGIEICKDFKGIIRRKITYKDDMMNGPWECFNENSKLIESREYLNDKLNGLTKRLNTSIDKYEEVRYLDDQLHGKNLVFQSKSSNGKTELTGSSTTEYVKGDKDGFMISFDKDGKEIKRLCYKEDKLKSENPELCGGAPIAKVESVKTDPYKGWKTNTFKSGKIKNKYLLVGFNNVEEAELFYENEKLKAQFKRVSLGSNLQTPDIYLYKEFNSRGKITAEGKCNIPGDRELDLEYGLCDYLTGVRYDYGYDDVNFLESKKNFINGRLEGVSYFYDKVDKVETQITYVKDVKVKLVERKMSDQSIIKSEEYYEDGSIK